MTLIAIWAPEGHPTLVGDLLTSSMSGPPIPDLPMAGSRQITATAGAFRPSGLRQKLSVISPNLALGWAGSEIVASVVFKEARQHFCDAPLTGDDFFEFFERLDLPEKNQVALVGLSNDSKKVHRFHLGAEVIEDPRLGRIYVGGSGRDHFLSLAKDVDFVGSSGSLNSLETAITKTLGLTGHALVREIDEGRNLEHFYGAGFEAITSSSDQGGTIAFRKIGSVSYVFWRYRDKILSLVPLLFNSQYLDDYLLITRLVLNENDEVLSKRYGKRVMRHVISPVTKREALELPPILPELQPFYLVSFIVDVVEGRHRYRMMIKKGGKPALFKTAGLDVEIEFSEKYLNDLQAHAETE